MLDYPHDCGTVDTYEQFNTFILALRLELVRAYQTAVDYLLVIMCL